MGLNEWMAALLTPPQCPCGAPSVEGELCDGCDDEGGNDWPGLTEAERNPGINEGLS